jgi:hypothetical protein
MYILEDIMLLMARERMEDAVRYAELMRAHHLARTRRRPVRARLRMALVRLGHWLMGRSSQAPGTSSSALTLPSDGR